MKTTDEMTRNVIGGGATNVSIPYLVRIVLVMVLLLPSLSTAAMARRESLAVITDLQGKVTVTTESKQQPGAILTYLGSGDALRIDAGVRLTLVYFSGKEYRYQGPAHIEVGAYHPQVLSGAAGTCRELAIIKDTGLNPWHYKHPGIPFRGGEEEKTSKVKILSPRNTIVLETRPTFRWKPVDTRVQYRFVLFDYDLRPLIVTLVNGTSFKIPAEIEIKEGVWYTWQVEVRPASGAVYSSSAVFNVLEKAKRQMLNQFRPGANSSVSERVVYASVLEQMVLREAAQQHWKELSAERPDAAELKKKATR